MNDTRRLFRRLTIIPGSGKGMPKGTYKNRWLAHRKMTADICCPDCGTVGSLDGHAIDRDGLVSPSVVCPKDGCEFHKWIQLSHWNA